LHAKKSKQTEKQLIIHILNQFPSILRNMDK